MPTTKALTGLALIISLALVFTFFAPPLLASKAAEPTPTPSPPQITLFCAVPDQLQEGGSFCLSWDSLGADEAFLRTGGLPGAGPVPTRGSMIFSNVDSGVYTLVLTVIQEGIISRTDEATTTVAISLPPGVTVVDDRDEGFVRAGTPAYWQEDGFGYRGHLFWTYTNGFVVDDRADWRPHLPRDGWYEVQVFIPTVHGTTVSARYEVYALDGWHIVVVNQLRYCGAWVSLDTHRFAAGEGGYVCLTDATGEDVASRRQIAFDAVRWILQPWHIHLPLALKAPGQ